MNQKRSKLLFIGEDGDSMVFHMSPSGEKNELKNLIEVCILCFWLLIKMSVTLCDP
jgi:hypothetical protein